ncbi:hypothetical protein [Burkholderia pseudomallei]|uniref:hypothetical protein n=1 Tax=Burkholderia pseudomallei TaxID=28450 RepID=UPI002115E299|nr:hypothetical protein [Burkholderia pseudomallei]
MKSHFAVGSLDQQTMPKPHCLVEGSSGYRVRADGEILHPYAGRRADDSWIICFYLPFMKEWGEMQEVEFIALPIAANIDVKQRAAQSPQPRRI